MTLRYVSTRGAAPDLDFTDALLTGLAVDGGLYCPETVPTLPELDPDAPYADTARAVMWPFVEGTIARADFDRMVDQAYRPFRDPDVCPLVDLGRGQYLLDLSKGPTLAFKDVALQLVGRLLDHELERRGDTAIVVAATSGDTGSAAIEALAGRTNVAAAVLHPRGRVSDVQRRQMTTVDAANVVNLAVDGTFDDCQDLVKAAFGDPDIRHSLRLAAVNSINWGRVMAQIVYYVHAWLRLGRPLVSFCVPTGNFGNVLAGWYAARMGVTVDRLVVASNRNDVLTRFFETGVLEAREVMASLSPSMDIQVSSNFERILWEASGRDGAAVARLLGEFRDQGRAAVPAEWCEWLAGQFSAGRVDDAATVAEIARIHDRLGLLIDPHTAVATKIAAEQAVEGIPMISLATADPAKFPDAVERATGVRPELPSFLSELMDRPEHMVETANDLGAVVAEMQVLAARS